MLFSHQTTSYSQIFFTHPVFVPAADIFSDFPSGCPNPCCTEDCEMIRFPRNGLDGAVVLPLKRGSRRRFRRVRAREMCNWVDCDVTFSEENTTPSGGSESSSSVSGNGSTRVPARQAVRGQVCGKCKLVKYCSAEHQRRDWEEHRRLCTRPAGGEEKNEHCK